MQNKVTFYTNAPSAELIAKSIRRTMEEKFQGTMPSGMTLFDDEPSTAFNVPCFRITIELEKEVENG